MSGIRAYVFGTLTGMALMVAVAFGLMRSGGKSIQMMREDESAEAYIRAGTQNSFQSRIEAYRDVVAKFPNTKGAENAALSLDTYTRFQADDR